MRHALLVVIAMFAGGAWGAPAVYAKVFNAQQKEDTKASASTPVQPAPADAAPCCRRCRCARTRDASAAPTARALSRPGRAAGRGRGMGGPRWSDTVPRRRRFGGERLGRALGCEGCGQGQFGARPPTAASATPLDDATKSALREALLDEFANELYYANVMQRFGAARPFANLHPAEQRHAAALINLFHRYGIEPATHDAAIVPAVPETRRAAIDLAITRERANVALYDRLLEKITKSDVRQVFERLRDASANRHLPALERQR